MKDKLKKIIETADEYMPGYDGKLIFDYVYLASTGKLYSGFWGKNGYNGFIVLGKINDHFYRIDLSQYDVVTLEGNIDCIIFDIPHELNCFRIFSDEGFVFEDTGVSSLKIKIVKDKIYGKN